MVDKGVVDKDAVDKDVIDKNAVDKDVIDNGDTKLALSHVGDGPNLLFVHGLGSAQLLWGPLVRVLQDRYRCWTLDLRGHGASDRTPGAYNLPGYGSDVAAALDHIAAPTVGIGHSLGGTSLARTAAGCHRHLRAVYLLDSGLFRPAGKTPPTALVELFNNQLAMLRQFQPENRPIEDYQEVLAAAPYPAGGTNQDVMVPEQLRGRAESLSLLDPDCIEATLAGFVASDKVARDKVARDKLPRDSVSLAFTIPTRVVAADPSLGAVFRPEHEGQLVALTPQATVFTMLGVAHQLMMIKGYDDEVRQDLEAWLADLEELV